MKRLKTHDSENATWLDNDTRQICTSKVYTNNVGTPIYKVTAKSHVRGYRVRDFMELWSQWQLS